MQQWTVKLGLVSAYAQCRQVALRQGASRSCVKTTSHSPNWPWRHINLQAVTPLQGVMDVPADTGWGCGRHWNVWSEQLMKKLLDLCKRQKYLCEHGDFPHSRYIYGKAVGRPGVIFIHGFLVHQCTITPPEVCPYVACLPSQFILLYISSLIKHLIKAKSRVEA